MEEEEEEDIRRSPGILRATMTIGVEKVVDSTM